MGKGLPRRAFQVFNGGGIDTKADPRLVPAGSLVEIENMYYEKTGELRLRNGFAALTVSGGGGTTGGLDNLFTDAQGSLMAIAGNWTGPALGGGASGKVAVKYTSTGTAPGWGPITALANQRMQYPTATVAVRGVEASTSVAASSAPDLYDSDMAVSGAMSLTAWRQGTGQRYVFRSLAGAQPLEADTGGVTIGGNSAPVVVATNTLYFGVFWADTGTGTVNWQIFGADGSNVASNSQAGVDLASAWIDARVLNGTNTIAVAYKASAGGVSCIIVNAATGNVTVGPVNTAGADASFALGWLDNTVDAGNVYLATAGSGAGVMLRTMSSGTLAVGATTTVDAAATASIKQVTGHVYSTGPLAYDVLWDVTGASSWLNSIKRSGSVSSATFTGFSLASRTFRNSDGQFHVIGVYDSTTQPTYAVLQAFSTPSTTRTVPRAIFMPGYAGGLHVAQSRLSSVTLSGGVSYAALPRRQKVTTAGGIVTSLRAIADVAITFATSNLCRPRELGGTLFMPGGIVMRDDLARTSWAVSPFYPEAPTGVSSVGGGMTASGAYGWRLVWRRIDSRGRVPRSAASVPLLQTLGAGDGTMTLTMQVPFLTVPGLIGGELVAIEVYRAGPAAAGSTNYNKVGEATVIAGTTTTFVDAMSDANAALGELLYSTGNVLENFVTPPCNLLEVNGNRVGIVNSEDPTEFWPSLEYKPGQGIRFNPLLAIPVTGDGYGGMTALAAMDGRWILFKSAAIYAIGGDGPNENSQGTFTRPQAASLNIGTVLPRSVVATPDGIMFQGAAGIYLLDRGLGLTFVGSPVQQYTLAANVVDASPVRGSTQIRFVMSNGRCLVWDYFQKKWVTFLLNITTSGVASTVTACADTAMGWCYALADGTVMVETPNVFEDINGSTIVPINPRVGFPALALDGINGYARFCGIDVLGQYVGGHTLSVQFEYDYSGGPTEVRNIAVSPGNYQYEVLPATQKCTSVKITLTTAAEAAFSGVFRLTGVTLWVAMKRGTNIPYTKRAT